jgi:Flp pilus assembly CpaF family ATPase
VLAAVTHAAPPDQIAHGFVIGVRHPNGRQLSSAMKTGQHGGVATICLHPITRLQRN